MKTCTSCKESYPKTKEYFHFKKDGYFDSYCKQCKVKKASAWYQDNKEKKRAYDEKRRIEKRHLYRAASKRHRDAHPEKKKADTNKRRAGIRAATPDWANKFFMDEAYSLARLRTKLTGIKWEVDHIIPFKNEIVSGLHVENNVQVIPAVDNLMKGNSYDTTR